jgi:DUF4097 and DUF4098 domain-containing protein YvlB
MSWLYSLFIAGILFAGEDLRPVTPPVEPSTPMAVQKDEIEKFERSYPLNPNGRVSVSNINGSIVVEAWDRNEVKLDATKRANTRELLSDVELLIDSDASRFRVEAEYRRSSPSGGSKGPGKYSRVEVEFKLWIPRGAVLDEIETVNGSVAISDFTNVTKVSAVNGDVSATRLRGAVDLSTVNGEVKCDVESVDAGSKISLSTVNGRVALSVPSDINATVKADTLNGSIVNDLGLPVRKGEYVGRDLYGRIGSGDAQIKLDSVNGPISITRKNDGRSPNPVTDLLPQMSRDRGAVSATDKVNRSIDRSVRASQRDAAAAMRRAQVELEKIKPELEKMKIEKLEKLKVDIDEKAIERSVADAMRAQGEAFAKMRSANWMTSVPRIERKTNVMKVSGTPKVRIDAGDCDVAIRGWSNSEVKYTLTEVTSGGERPDADVKESVNGSNVAITVTGTDGDPGSGLLPGQHRYRLEVYVPVRSDITVSSEGEIRVNGVKGTVDITGADGSVDIRDSEGEMKIAARDGQIRIVGFSGSLDLVSVDGPVYLDGEFSSIATRTVDGAVVLALPASPDATIRSNQPIIADHPAARQNSGVVKFGNGAANYKLDSRSGSITIRRSALIAAK